MKIYLIKHTDCKNRPINMIYNRDYIKGEVINMPLAFFRKKDAKTYLENNYSETVQKYREIVSAELR